MLDQVKNYKERMQKVLAEAMEANNQQLLSGSTDDYAGYKFLVGIGQTLNDMSDRLETEYKKLYKDKEILSNAVKKDDYCYKFLY